MPANKPLELPGHVGGQCYASRITGSDLHFHHRVGIKAMHREVAQLEGTYMLREQSEAYGEDFASENDSLTLNNTILWEENIETAGT
jgi:hypothetical protein